MQIRSLSFRGNFEEDSQEQSETLQIVVPEDTFEAEFLAWAILPHGETVDDDSVRRNYVFHYALHEHLGDGLYRLRMTGRDASRKEHVTEIVAAMVVTPTTAPVQPGRSASFAPFWFISKRLHFTPRRDSDPYPGPAFGQLLFGDNGHLPHRRLFGMLTGASGQL